MNEGSASESITVSTFIVIMLMCSVFWTTEKLEISFGYTGILAGRISFLLVFDLLTGFVYNKKKTLDERDHHLLLPCET